MRASRDTILVLAAGMIAGCTVPQALFDGGRPFDAGLDAPSGDPDAPAIDAPGLDAPGLDAPAIDARTADATALDAASTDAPDARRDPLPDARANDVGPFDAGRNPACDMQFGGLPGYVYCGSTVGAGGGTASCELHRTSIGPGDDCRQTCVGAGGDCSLAYEAVAPGSCARLRPVGCGSGAGDICVCTTTP